MRFVDLHLCPSAGNLEQAKRLIAKSAELGYSQIGVPFPPGVKTETIRALQQIADEYSLDLVTRVDIAARSPRELLAGVRRFRRSFEVVAAVCSSKPVALQAARDRRVDLLCLPFKDSSRRLFGRAEAGLASASGAALELDLAQLLISFEAGSVVGFLSRLRRDVAVAKSCGVPLVFSSGSSEPRFLRKPKEYAALASLFNADESIALEAFSVHPAGIVERNRRKLSPEYVAPGVRVIREAGVR